MIGSEISTQKAHGALEEKKENGDTVKKFIDTLRPQIEQALPKQINFDRFIRVIMTELRKNPDLLQCSSMSLMGALMTASQYGLEIGATLGHCYLIPYKKEVEFQIGYKGLIDIMYRDQEVKNIYAEWVGENEEFSVTMGLDPYITHEYNYKDRGKLVCAYAVVTYKDGSKFFAVATKSEIEKSRSLAKTQMVWSRFYEEMSLKVAIRKLSKFLKKNIEIQDMVQNDGIVKKFDIQREDYTQINENDIIDIDYEVKKAEKKLKTKKTKETKEIKKESVKTEENNNQNFTKEVIEVVDGTELMNINMLSKQHGKLDKEFYNYLMNNYGIQSKTEILKSNYIEICNWITKKGQIPEFG